MSELADLHKERQALATLLGCLPGDRIPVGGTVLQDRARAMARRDWAVRVLDAWAALEDGRNAVPILFDGAWCVRFRTPAGHGCDDIEDFVVTAVSPDSARHAAALAVFPTLPIEARERLGECP